MALFPTVSTEYYMEHDTGISKFMNDFYASSITMNQMFWSEAAIDTRFLAGDQSVVDSVYGGIPASKRKSFNFNHIRPVINTTSGYQRKNRKSTVVVPVENADEHTADQYTKILMWIDQQEGTSDTLSRSFHSALVTGLSLMQVWVDYRNDPISGNIKIDCCDYNTFIIDPFFRKPDLSDCNGIWKRSFLSKQECLSLLPEHDDFIGSLVGNAGQDGKFNFLPENYSGNIRNLLTYDEFYYRAYRSQKMIVDTQTGESIEWMGKSDSDLEDFLRFYPQLTVIKQDVPTVRVAIAVQGKVVYDGPNPTGLDDYSFVPVFGYYDSTLPTFENRIQGMVRSLRDPQFLFNRRKLIELNMLESNITTGWKFKENALIDPKSVYMTGEGRGIGIKSEASMDDVQQIMPPVIPPTTLQVSEILRNEISEISGVSKEMAGSAVDDVSGILSMLRQGAGLTTLQPLFDALDFSQKLLGKKMLNIIQANFTPGKVQRIIEEEPAPQFYNKTFGKYDAAVEEGLNTTTQRQMQFAQLVQLRQIGVPIPDDIMLEACTIQDKQKLTQRMQQMQEQQAQAQQMQMQVALQEQQASIELTKARTQADQGLGIERVSRVKENQALAEERKAEAAKDRMAGLLDLVKAIKEIEGADLLQLEKLLALSQIANNAGAEQNKQRDQVNPSGRGLEGR